MARDLPPDLQEELLQIRSLGWKWKRWLRREQKLLEKVQPLTGREIVPEGFEVVSDLVWVLKGSDRSGSLTEAQRHVLMMVHNAGRRRAAKLLGLRRPELQRILTRIERILYKNRGEVKHG